MEVIITEEFEMPREVVTQVELDTAEIKNIIDMMWSSDTTESSVIATRHNVDDINLEKKLNIALGRAYDELDIGPSGYRGLRLDEIQEWN